MPGGQAKWVRGPRGAATVSGERHSHAGSSGSHCGQNVGRVFRPARLDRGKAEDARDDPQARIPGWPGPFTSSHRREITPKGGPVLYSLVRFCLAVSLLPVTTTPDAITGVVVDAS